MLYIVNVGLRPILIIENKIHRYVKEIYLKHGIEEEIKEIISSDWRNENYTPIQKEVINSTTEFFYFIENKENFLILDEIYDITFKNLEKIKIVFKDNKSFFLTIIILKSFLHYSPILTTNLGNSKNSDKLLDYCVEIYTSYCVFFDLEINKRKIRSSFYMYFHLLIKAKIVIENKIKNKKFLSKFWGINVKKKVECDYGNFKISYTPFLIKKKNECTYLIGLFFWNVYDIYTKNFYSNTRFNITKEEYLDLLIKRYLHIDISRFSLIKKICLSSEKNENLEEMNKKLIETMDKLNWNIETKKKIEEIQLKYSIRINEIILENFLNIKWNENDKMYFPFYFDFRGRKYYNSIIGPTQNKTLRFVYHYGWYNSDDFSNVIKIERIEFFKEKIENFCKENKLEYNEIFLESYFWLLIGIGKFGINKTEIEVSDDTIIEKGVSIYVEKNLEKFNVHEKIEIIHYMDIMKSLRIDKMNKIRKRIISKDGTASVYQISMILLKPINQESLKWVNLFNENNWIDTYSFIIKKFKENSKTSEDFLNILNRKTAKKVLMTIPYSIGNEKAYENFLIDLKKNGISCEKNLRKDFNHFFNFVKNNFEKINFYEKTTKEYTDEIIKIFLDSRSIKITSTTGETDLAYKKMQKKVIDQIFEMKINEEIIKERITKMMLVSTNSVDVKQTKISLGANLRHFYEADLLRMTEISLNYSINSIHDAELIDFNSCSKLIIIKNRIFKELLPNFEIKSNFILI